MSEKTKKLVKPEIVALHDDNHHDGDEVKQFAFKDEMGRITQLLEIGSVYFVKYNTPLETSSGKKITAAQGKLTDVEGHFGLEEAIIWYENRETAQKSMILGLISGMTLTKIDI